eukprot:TRINITY_DN10857_c0_g1_i1.p1 TRINITY_DN10857_c0_g1~~TRINITY_DN10857_c0_g1_i1.p1  ORF type:complete len:1583 (-),score=353.88 TRINITY_DN10857_c0_g1_i1:39-4787(-)
MPEAHQKETLHRKVTRRSKAAPLEAPSPAPRPCRVQDASENTTDVDGTAELDDGRQRRLSVWETTWGDCEKIVLLSGSSRSSTSCHQEEHDDSPMSVAFPPESITETLQHRTRQNRPCGDVGGSPSRSNQVEFHQAYDDLKSELVASVPNTVVRHFERKLCEIVNETLQPMQDLSAEIKLHLVKMTTRNRGRLDADVEDVISATVAEAQAQAESLVHQVRVNTSRLIADGLKEAAAVQAQWQVKQKEELRESVSERLVECWKEVAVAQAHAQVRQTEDLRAGISDRLVECWKEASAAQVRAQVQQAKALQAGVSERLMQSWKDVSTEQAKAFAQSAEEMQAGVSDRLVKCWKEASVVQAQAQVQQSEKLQAGFCERLVKCWKETAVAQARTHVQQMEELQAGISERLVKCWKEAAASQARVQVQQTELQAGVVERLVQCWKEASAAQAQAYAQQTEEMKAGVSDRLVECWKEAAVAQAQAQVHQMEKLQAGVSKRLVDCWKEAAVAQAQANMQQTAELQVGVSERLVKCWKEAAASQARAQLQQTEMQAGIAERLVQSWKEVAAAQAQATAQQTEELQTGVSERLAKRWKEAAVAQARTHVQQMEELQAGVSERLVKCWKEAAVAQARAQVQQTHELQTGVSKCWKEAAVEQARSHGKQIEELREGVTERLDEFRRSMTEQLMRSFREDLRRTFAEIAAQQQGAASTRQGDLLDAQLQHTKAMPSSGSLDFEGISHVGLSDDLKRSLAEQVARLVRDDVRGTLAEMLAQQHANELPSSASVRYKEGLQAGLSDDFRTSLAEQVARLLRDDVRGTLTEMLAHQHANELPSSASVRYEEGLQAGLSDDFRKSLAEQVARVVRDDVRGTIEDIAAARSIPAPTNRSKTSRSARGRVRSCAATDDASSWPSSARPDGVRPLPLQLVMPCDPTEAIVQRAARIEPSTGGASISADVASCSSTTSTVNSMSSSGAGRKARGASGTAVLTASEPPSGRETSKLSKTHKRGRAGASKEQPVARPGRESVVDSADFKVTGCKPRQVLYGSQQDGVEESKKKQTYGVDKMQGGIHYPQVGNIPSPEEQPKDLLQNQLMKLLAPRESEREHKPPYAKGSMCTDDTLEHQEAQLCAVDQVPSTDADSGDVVKTTTSASDFRDTLKMRRHHRGSEELQGEWWVRFGKSDRLECLASLVVVAATLFLAIQTNVEAVSPMSTVPGYFLAVDFLFAAIFTGEFGWRFAAYGSDHFFSGAIRHRHIYDTVTVTLTDLDALLRIGWALADTSSTPVAWGFLRLLRLGKFMRICRLLSAVPELKMMVYLISASVQSFMWAIVLMFLMICVMAVYFTEVATKMVRDGLHTRNDVLEQWGSVSSSILSLFMAISGGDDWSVFVATFMADKSYVGTFNIVVFSAYVAFMALVTMNLVTGVFVEGAQRLISNDKDAAFLAQTQGIFGVTDEDGDMEISWEEFQDLIETQQMSDYFKSCDVNQKAAKGLFRMLDADQSGTLSVDEFVMGCLRLRGQARSVDLVHLSIVIVESERLRDRQTLDIHHQIRRLNCQVSRLTNMTESFLKRLGIEVPNPVTVRSTAVVMP